MNLSEELQQLHDSGDVGWAVDGFAERALALEQENDLLQKRLAFALERGAQYHEGVLWVDNATHTQCHRYRTDDPMSTLDEIMLEEFHHENSR